MSENDNGSEVEEDVSAPPALDDVPEDADELVGEEVEGDLVEEED